MVTAGQKITVYYRKKNGNDEGNCYTWKAGEQTIKKRAYCILSALLPRTGVGPARHFTVEGF